VTGALFDLDKWQEVLHTLRRNKLRTLMTALGVMWGIFMLVLMLGFGNGLERGVMKNMVGFVSNSVYVWGQRTSKPYKGLAPGRSIRFTTRDIAAIENGVSGIWALAPRNQLGGWRDGNNVTYGQKTGNFGVMGDYPALLHIENMDILAGRFINDADMEGKRKVTVIGQHVKEVLFGAEDPIGKYVKIRGAFFRVVGVHRSNQPGQQGDRANSTLYVPFSTFQVAFNNGQRVGWFAIAALPEVSGEQLEREIRRTLAANHWVHPDDGQAIGSYNAAEKFGRMQNLFRGIRFFIWFVSLATLMAGALGVSNIMLISVKERTREIGVRKAIGATPASIVMMVLQESVVLTALAGYLGLFVGVVTLELVGSLVRGTSGPLAAPEIDFGVALVAGGILMVIGLVAGIAPARHAATIRPVVALRTE